jgi:hypothetical protein
MLNSGPAAPFRPGTEVESAVTAADNDLSFGAGFGGFEVTVGGLSLFKPRPWILLRTALKPRPSCFAMALAEWVGCSAVCFLISSSLHADFVWLDWVSWFLPASFESPVGPFWPGGDDRRDTCSSSSGAPSPRTVGFLTLDRRFLPKAGMAVPDSAAAWRPSLGDSIAGFRFAAISWESGRTVPSSSRFSGSGGAHSVMTALLSRDSGTSLPSSRRRWPQSPSFSARSQCCRR